MVQESKKRRGRVLLPLVNIDEAEGGALVTARDVAAFNGVTLAVQRKQDRDGLGAPAVHVTGTREKRYLVREVRAVRALRFANTPTPHIREFVRLLKEARVTAAPPLPPMLADHREAA